SASASASASAPTEYTPSIEEQYLPKSLRGNNNNPYSIMNAVTETINKKGDNVNTLIVPKPDDGHIPSTAAAAATVALDTAMNSPPITSGSNTSSTPSADSVTLLASVPVAEYASTQKEVTIPSITTVNTINL
ncbi:hypothetical protein EBU71_21240, partial [bacterium]|nr:hypothetical protein [Candidatus Elulimicrobium humile]